MGERRVQRRGRCCGWRRRIAGQRVSGQLCEQPQRALGRRARLPARYSASSARFILDCRCRRRGRTSRRGGGSSWLAVAGHRGGRYEQRAGRVRMLGRSYPLVLAAKRGGFTGRKKRAAHPRHSALSGPQLVRGSDCAAWRCRDVDPPRGSCGRALASPISSSQQRREFLST